ncbi:uncharacterized protein LOC124913260 [Impatiens glandulifera]|uniref:uncharacterized protein LOC124913260 n=1 Tax=Impatiens glandulifera TaxID=253017 RepID=UPI001FB0EDFA|nr:uncharacterized protein LOC124913260 [Impatiens glandulifera]
MISNKVWNTIRDKEEIVDWANLVWSSKVIPRHQFILWLAFQEILNTRDRVKKYMEILDSSCLLCEGNEEIVDHLFGNYSFASKLWNKFAKNIEMTRFPEDWKEIKEVSMKKAKCTKFKSKIFKYGFGSTVYNIGRERNARAFSRNQRSLKQTWDNIVTYCNANIQTWRRVPKNEQNWNLYRNWNVSYQKVTKDTVFLAR